MISPDLTRSPPISTDLLRSPQVLCLLANGAPHGLRVLTPWTSAGPRVARPSSDFSLPLGYYVVMRGWHSPALHSILAKGWSATHNAIASARDDASGAAALEALKAAQHSEPALLVPCSPRPRLPASRLLGPQPRPSASAVSRAPCHEHLPASPHSLATQPPTPQSARSRP